jgi:hypothetical protein
MAVGSVVVNASVADGPLVGGGTVVSVGAAGAVRSMVNVRES